MTVYRYKRVSVSEGKHGRGDYRVTLSGLAPTHSELVALLWWIFEAEDRYPVYGRQLLRLNIDRAYFKDTDLATILRDIDGAEVAA